jgi:hypothetical protein
MKKPKPSKAKKPSPLKGEELYLSLQKQWKNHRALRRKPPSK